MALFSKSEYRNRTDRLSVRDAWGRLPVVVTIDGIQVKWVGPMICLGQDVWLGDMSNAAWGYLAFCGWSELLEEVGPMLGSEGDIRAEWASAFGQAARRLAEEGLRSGPENNPDCWGSWIAFAISEPHQYVRTRAEANGWDR